MIKKLLAAVVFLAPVGLAQACGDDFCNVGEADCTSANAYSICGRAGDSPGPSHLTTETCPAEQHCVTRSKNVVACVGQSVGGSCKSDQGCESGLRCGQGTCVAPPDMDVALCNAAPMIALPEKSPMDLDVEVNGADAAFVQMLVRPALGDLDQPTTTDATRFAIFRVTPSLLPSNPLLTRQPDDDTSPVLVLLRATCPRLYDTAPGDDASNAGRDVFIAVVKSSFTGASVRVHGERI